MRTSVRFGVAVLAAVAMVPTANVFAQSQSRQVSSDDEDDDGERIVCRRSVDTGSLVKGRRQCFTRTQWDRIAEAAQKKATDMQENLRGRPSGE